MSIYLPTPGTYSLPFAPGYTCVTQYYGQQEELYTCTLQWKYQSVNEGRGPGAGELYTDWRVRQGGE